MYEDANFSRFYNSLQIEDEWQSRIAFMKAIRLINAAQKPKISTLAEDVFSAI